MQNLHPIREMALVQTMNRPDFATRPDHPQTVCDAEGLGTPARRHGRWCHLGSGVLIAFTLKGVFSVSLILLAAVRALDIL